MRQRPDRKKKGLFLETAGAWDRARTAETSERGPAPPWPQPPERSLLLPSNYRPTRPRRKSRRTRSSRLRRGVFRRHAFSSEGGESVANKKSSRAWGRARDGRNSPARFRSSELYRLEWRIEIPRFLGFDGSVRWRPIPYLLVAFAPDRPRRFTRTPSWKEASESGGTFAKRVVAHAGNAPKNQFSDLGPTSQEAIRR